MEKCYFCKVASWSAQRIRVIWKWYKKLTLYEKWSQDIYLKIFDAQMFDRFFLCVYIQKQNR